MLHRLIKHFKSDSLFRNAVFLMASTGILGVSGFAFWLVVSHLYPAVLVGRATAIISAATLLATLSTLGMNNVLIRFLAGAERKTAYLSTAATTTTIASVVLGAAGAVWLAIAGVFDNAHLVAYVAIFVLFVVITTFNVVLEGCFIAFRQAGYVLAKNIIVSVVKVALPVLAVSLGALSIVGSIAVASLIACGVVTYFLMTRNPVRMGFALDRKVIAQTRRFALGNFLGTSLAMVPMTVLPLMVAAGLGTEQAAYIYIPLMFITLINVIPLSSAQSFFAEASHDEANLTLLLGKSVRGMLLLMVPVVALVVVTAPVLLALFGGNYASEGANALRLMAVGSLIGSFNFIGDTLLNVQKRVNRYLILNGISAGFVLVLTGVASHYGLTAIGGAFLLAQTLTVLAYVVVHRGIIAETWSSLRA